MAQAIATAELLSAYVAQKDVSQEAWMWKFERERRAMLRGREIATTAILWLATHPRLGVGAFQAMRATPMVFSHIVSVCGGARELWGAQTAS
jgi:hypothetical protein